MAKLYRNTATDEYYIDTAMDGEFVTLQIHPEGREYLVQQGVEEGDRVPAEVFVVLEENDWLTALKDDSLFSPDTDVSVREPQPVRNENLSETNAIVTDLRVPPDEPLPSVRLEPRPWMEQENVERMRSETDPMAADAGHPQRTFSATPADKANANPLTHPEDAAFIGGVWFWVLVVAAVAIIGWGLIELF